MIGGRKNMKKIIILLWLILIPLFTIEALGAESIQTLRVHYYRYDQTYTNFNIWLWENQPVSRGGIQWNFDSSNVGEQGVYLDVDLATSYPNATRLGIIIKQGGWEGYREIGGDRFFELSDVEYDANGLGHVYFVEQDIRIGTSQVDLDNNVPDYRDKVLTANFVESGNNYLIEVSATNRVVSYEIFENGGVTPFSTGNVNASTFNANATFNISNRYEVEVTFEDNTVARKSVSLERIFDTQNFEALYTYEGDLGVTFEGDETIIRLWAPLSSEVMLNLYRQGHPNYTDEGVRNDELTPFETHALEPIGQGAWEIRLTGDYDFVYYTFDVTNGDMTTRDITDPYAYSAGANGLRSMIVNFDAINPEGWRYNNRPDTIENNTDYIIYELHVRDLTTHESWNGTESYRGNFLGLTETGTTYTNKDGVTVTTGLDHIVELGVNAVHLLPIADFGYVDEVEFALNSNYTNRFNWGYMTIHFNVLEGTFSTNPFDGRARVTEFKEAVMALHEHGIRVIMDVVYNHTGLSETSNFHQIVPGYYHRLTPSGGFSNGSGTGNETASERSMMRKFILDSTEFLATEYDLSGFRFDLMALHDYETMNLVGERMREIDETFIVYGEPWMGGTSPLPENQTAGKTNIKNMSEYEIAAFNDVTRDAIKGSVFNSNEGGWVQGKSLADNYVRLKYGMVGGIDHQDVGFYDPWHGDPDQTVNYASAHDNNTLFDKLVLTGFSVSNELNRLKSMAIQSNAIVLTSQGIPFLHAGVEFLRSKPLPDGGFDHNSYESPDSVNQLRWDRKARFVDVFEYYKDLIYIRKAYDNFRMTDPTIIESLVTFLDTDQVYGGIAMRIQPLNNDGADIIVIHSGHAPRNGLTRVTLPAGKEYHVLTALGESDVTEGIVTLSGTANVTPNTTMILTDTLMTYTAPEFPTYGGGSDSEGLSLGMITTIGTIVVIAAAGSIFFLKKKPTE